MKPPFWQAGPKGWWGRRGERNGRGPLPPRSVALPRTPGTVDAIAALPPGVGAALRRIKSGLWIGKGKLEKSRPNLGSIWFLTPIPCLTHDSFPRQRVLGP